MNRGQEGSGASLTYEVGIVASTPIPDVQNKEQISGLVAEAYSLARQKYEKVETSSAFILPEPFQLADKPHSPESRLLEIQGQIDSIIESAYRVPASDMEEVKRWISRDGFGKPVDEDEDLDDVYRDEAEDTNNRKTWAAGVAFGRFDWRLATGERKVSPEHKPLDSLPSKSPGMLPDGAAPFHDHSGILVDDQGHPHDLARLIEEVLTRVEAYVPADVRRWLQRDFFPLHLKQYSKSRRKAPIYWPLSTTSGSYTLWLYFPSLTSQTLYTAVNDFVEPKLKQVSRDAATLRDKGAARTRDDEKAFEALQVLELELIELRDTLLDIAPSYRPNHDDGVQITAAPLWPLFRHKPWQKTLKDTWAKLEKGDYDWAKLAMTYWPDRVREKCKADKSLAIAHELEDLYEPAPTTEGGKKKKKGSGA
jgi:hypothetical protein